MNKILEFFKSHLIIVKWTIWYFFIFWLILKCIFGFDMVSYHYWWKFFHATLHGFFGFVFGALICSMIPLYIVTTTITYRNQEYVIKIPFIDKVFAFISKIFKKPEQKSEEKIIEEPAPEPEQQTTKQYPDDLPPELRIPFMRAKQHLPLTGAISTYNKPISKTSTQIQTNEEPTSNEIPIPNDFDIGDAFDTTTDSVPTFTDINFDTPISTETQLQNNTTKYFDKTNTEYETYHEFVATEKYLIYEHNDEDFWVMDGDTWFASGKQKDSPINELIEIAKQNGLQPVIYLASENIMDVDGTIKNFETNNIRVIKNLDDLD